MWRHLTLQSTIDIFFSLPSLGLSINHNIVSKCLITAKIYGRVSCTPLPFLYNGGGTISLKDALRLGVKTLCSMEILVLCVYSFFHFFHFCFSHRIYSVVSFHFISASSVMLASKVSKVYLPTIKNDLTLIFFEQLMQNPVAFFYHSLLLYFDE